MIRADSIRHAFGGREILRDVALSLRQGEVVGLFGANGSGKSVLLRILFGQLRADHAYLSVDDIQLSVPYRVPGLINFRPQGQTFPRHLTVGRLLQFHQLEETVFFADYPTFASKTQNTMSSVNWRLFEPLVLLEVPTRFTLLDEPFAGLAPLTVELVQETILKKRSDKGILLTGHGYREVLAVADRSYLVSDGVLRSASSEEELAALGYTPDQ